MHRFAAPSTTDAVTQLIAAASGDDADINGYLLRFGDRTVAEVMLNEMLDRFELSDLNYDDDAAVCLVWWYSEGEARYTVVAGRAGIECHEGDRNAPVVVSQSMAEVVRSVLGPTVAAQPSTRRINWRDLEICNPFRSNSAPVIVLMQRLLSSLDRGNLVDLSALAVRYGTDKWGLHQYAPIYEKHFGMMRRNRLTLLEIGVGGYDDPASGGASLRMWRSYFPRGMIYGIDSADKSDVDGQRITTFKADQADVSALAEIAAKTGPLDIVIDDGSHRSTDVIASFHALFPHMRSGGMYVVEDVQTSYWSVAGGNDVDRNDPRTSMGFFKTLLDGLNHEEIDESNRARLSTDEMISGMHFYHNLVIIEKGSNSEGSAVSRLGSWFPEPA